MRSSRTGKRGLIALIQKGTGKITGLATIINVLGPLDKSQLLQNFDKHKVPADMINAAGYKWDFAWVIDKAIPLAHPIPYKHKSGAVIWVELENDVRRQIGEQITDSGWGELKQQHDTSANISTGGHVEGDSIPVVDVSRETLVNTDTLRLNVRIPVAKDGTAFDPEFCLRSDHYVVGKKGQEKKYTSYEDALHFLNAMQTPKWRRPNTNGNWGIVSGVSWRSRND